MTHRDDEPKRNPMVKGAVVAFGLWAGAVLVLMGVWALVFAGRTVGASLLAAGIALLGAALMIGARA